MVWQFWIVVAFLAFNIVVIAKNIHQGKAEPIDGWVVLTAGVLIALIFWGANT